MAAETLTLAGNAGDLEALLELPDDAEPAGTAVICHPHPLYGGTLHNKVVHTLARAFNLAGMAALRFNFRGVGASEGEHDQGRGEVDDVRVACEVMRRRWPAGPLWLAGFSFGAAMALRAIQQCHPFGLVTVAPPVTGLEKLAPGSEVYWLLVQGEADEVIDAQAVLAWAQSRQQPPQIRRMPGVGHFFHGQLPALREAVVAFVETHHR